MPDTVWAVNEVFLETRNRNQTPGIRSPNPNPDPHTNPNLNANPPCMATTEHGISSHLISPLLCLFASHLISSLLCLFSEVAPALSTPNHPIPDMTRRYCRRSATWSRYRARRPPRRSERCVCACVRVCAWLPRGCGTVDRVHVPASTSTHLLLSTSSHLPRPGSHQHGRTHAPNQAAKAATRHGGGGGGGGGGPAAKRSRYA